MINLKKNNNYDYVSNTYPMPCTYPDGSDIEIFDFKTLKKLSISKASITKRACYFLHVAIKAF